MMPESLKVLKWETDPFKLKANEFGTRYMFYVRKEMHRVGRDPDWGSGMRSTAFLGHSCSTLFLDDLGEQR